MDSRPVLTVLCPELTLHVLLCFCFFWMRIYCALLNTYLKSNVQAKEFGCNNSQCCKVVKISFLCLYSASQGRKRAGIHQSRPLSWLTVVFQESGCGYSIRDNDLDFRICHGRTCFSLWCRRVLVSSSDFLGIFQRSECKRHESLILEHLVTPKEQPLPGHLGKLEETVTTNVFVAVVAAHRWGIIFKAVYVT